MPLSKRTSDRNRIVEMAKLRTKSGTVYSCIVRDISEGGAKLRIPKDLEIEGQVVITSKTLGDKRVARVMWQDQSSIGIAFEA